MRQMDRWHTKRLNDSSAECITIHMTVCMQRRQLYIPVFQIDTNLINARQKLTAVNLLEKWSRDEVILLNMSSTAHGEASAGGDVARTRKANKHIFTVTSPAQDDDPTFRNVENAIFPNGALNENQRNDVRIICEAAKYQAILITNDGDSQTQPGGILGNREKLGNLVRILSPDEAVDYVRQKIQERDNFNVKYVKEFGGTLPWWTGRD